MLRKLTITILIFTGFVSLSQTKIQNDTVQFLFTPSDSTWLVNLPEVILPEHLKTIELPFRLDNSEQPFFRPIFSQAGPSCGQSSAIGYAFTYEINRLRDLPADTSINQYPSHFTYNFMNGGSGYFGVNYMHSFEILRTLGTPNVEEYGGMSIDDGELWISGYDLYYSAMKNRIRGVNKIKVGTPEGLLTLKHWLVNHLEGSEIGGIANFNAGSPWNYQTLPPESPEAGKHAMVQFSGTYATHAMTIVGYNDSIRFDYNEDGLFTNHLDINGDGTVDMRDWEIGGVLFANTYGNNWADSGFCYMMYKVLADDVTIGGIWNNTVHILDAKETYEPLLTMKLTLKHDSREKIRVAAGVTTDTAKLKPDHFLYFPVFNYQGGHNYMQGGRNEEEKKTIEFGLDLTPLLSHVEPGQFAKFFVEIHENDSKNAGAGEIVQFSIMDYSNGVNEIACPLTNYPIADNQKTRLSVVHNPDFDKVSITNDELPPFATGQSYEIQMEASGGTPEYNWELKTSYHQQMFTADFPAIEQKELIPEAPHYKYAGQEIEFSFPFYGEKFSKVYVHRDGYIMFGEDAYPWSYYNDGYLLFRHIKAIAAFFFYPVKYYPGTKGEDGIWYVGDETYAAFRWKKPLLHHDHSVGFGEFAVKLYPDGTIEYFFNDILLEEDILWYAGVSAGLNIDHTIIENANSSRLPGFSAYRLIPELVPENFVLSEDGWLSGNPQSDETIQNLNFKVTDDKGISTVKTLQLSDGLIFEYTLISAENSTIQSGDVVSVNLTVKNISAQSFDNVNASIISKDPNLEIINESAFFGNLQPGQSITVEDAFGISISANCPDQYEFLLDLQLVTNEAERTGKITFKTQAPALYMRDYQVVDNDNQRLDPGETADMLITVTNEGNALAKNVTGLLYSNDPYITINNPAPIAFGNLPSGGSGQNNFSVTVSSSCPISHEANFYFLIETENGVEVLESFSLSIGQFPMMVINLAKDELSVSVIQATLDELNFPYIYSDTIPSQPEIYRAIMLCLGTFYTNTALTGNQGLLLSDFLNKGGKLYLEGTMTWYIDPQTAVHPKFSTNVTTVANWIAFNSLLGIEGSFAEGLEIDFTGTYKLLPAYFEPISPGFPVFQVDNGENIFIMTAFENDTYKTIGSILEFGSFGDAGDLDDRLELMLGIIEFFELENYLTDIPEIISVQNPVSVFPNPFKDQTNWQIRSSAEAPTTITIFDLNGLVIDQLLIQSGEAGGFKSIVWESGKNMLPGVYIYQAKTGESLVTGKLVKMK